MSEYLLGMIGIVLIGGLLATILPQGKMAEVLKAVIRLACLVAILAPILQFLMGVDTLDDFFEKSVIQTDREFIQYCSEIHVESAEKTIEQQLNDEFEVQSTVTINWSFQEQTAGSYSIERIHIDKITVLLEDEAQLTEKIRAFLTECYACRIEVKQ